MVVTLLTSQEETSPLKVECMTGAGDTTSWSLCFDVLGSHRNYDRYDPLPFFFLNEKKTQKAGENFVVLAHNNARSSN
jgi:hypothetical protein